MCLCLPVTGIGSQVEAGHGPALWSEAIHSSTWPSEQQATSMGILHPDQMRVAHSCVATQWLSVLIGLSLNPSVSWSHKGSKAPCLWSGHGRLQAVWEEKLHTWSFLQQSPPQSWAEAGWRQAAMHSWRLLFPGNAINEECKMGRKLGTNSQYVHRTNRWAGKRRKIGRDFQRYTIRGMTKEGEMWKWTLKMSKKKEIQ